MDWKEIKQEYVTGGNEVSYNFLVAKYGVSRSAVSRRAKKEHWVQDRTQYRDKVNTKVIEKAAEQQSKAQVKKDEKIFELADKVLGKLELAIDQMYPDDIKAYRQISATLKDLKDIKMLKTEADMREQEARIKKLNKEIDEGNTDTKISIEFKGAAEEWSN